MVWGLAKSCYHLSMFIHSIPFHLNYQQICIYERNNKMGCSAKGCGVCIIMVQGISSQFFTAEKKLRVAYSNLTLEICRPQRFLVLHPGIRDLLVKKSTVLQRYLGQKLKS